MSGSGYGSFSSAGKSCHRNYLWSVPLPLGVAMQSIDKFMVAFPAPDRAFHKVDSPSQIGESDSACRIIEDCCHRHQSQP